MGNIKNNFFLSKKYKLIYIPADCFGFTYSNCSGNSFPSGCTMKEIPDFLEMTFDKFLIGSTDILHMIDHEINYNLPK